MAHDMNVTIFADRRKVGTGRLTDKGIIAGFTGIFPSRDPMATTNALDAVETALRAGTSGPVTLYGMEVTWTTSRLNLS